MPLKVVGCVRNGQLYPSMSQGRVRGVVREVELR